MFAVADSDSVREVFSALPPRAAENANDQLHNAGGQHGNQRREEGRLPAARAGKGQAAAAKHLEHFIEETSPPKMKLIPSLP
ncbi:hypothetical protein MJ579_04375 [Klebsiella pneumoniae]|nr:hypothetical protein MJ579_04375 [Klebsiella pneumoniae]